MNDWNRNLGQFCQLKLKFDNIFIDKNNASIRKSIDLTGGNCPSVPSAHCTKRDERRRAKSDRLRIRDRMARRCDKYRDVHAC